MVFEKLLEPGRIGKLELRNRLIMAPMGAMGGSKEGFLNETAVKYYEVRAKGGAALINTGAVSVEPIYQYSEGKAIFSDAHIAGWVNVADAVHIHGAKIFLQLQHPGRSWWSPPRPVAPSPIPCYSFMLGNAETPRELTTLEVEDLVEKFAQAAKRGQVAGFDGVELHCAHGYLGNQFLSAAFNKRTDKYGGSLEHRTRFVVEIFERIRELCGSGFAIAIRMNGDDLYPGGNTLEDYKVVAKILENVGFCYLSVCGGTHDSTRERLYGGATQAMGVAPGWFVPLAAGIKSVVRIPVITAGGLGIDLQLAETVLQEGKADFIAIGRPLLADPELPNKVRTGRLYDINWCIQCTECHPHDKDYIKTPHTRCTVNAFMEKEADPSWAITPAVKPKKIVVVGGGPGGMEAARVAKLRRHDVTLYEKSSELGGQIIVAAKPPWKEGMARTVGYLSDQMRKLGVKVEMGVKATPELIEKVRPDAVILATGSSPDFPDIPGIKGKNVVANRDVLSGEAETGQKVVILGGNVQGAETADFLASQGKKVTILIRRTLEVLERDTGRGPITPLMKEYLPDLCGIARDVGRRFREELLQRLDRGGVKAIYGCRLNEITDKGVKITRVDGKHLIEADTVVLALGSKPNNKLYGKLWGKVPELYMVGDCIKPRTEMEAISEGAEVGLKV